MSAEQCLQLVTGECGGCLIQEIAAGKINEAQAAIGAGDALVDRAAIVVRVSRIYCPTGTKMQMPERVRQSVW